MTDIRFELWYLNIESSVTGTGSLGYIASLEMHQYVSKLSVHTVIECQCQS